jgi:endonuclease YncB( thermonuclease family)
MGNHTSLDVDPATVERVPHQGKLIKAKIVKVYDGDTVTCHYAYGNRVLQTNIRVFGIDAPELKVKNGKDATGKKSRQTQLEERAGMLVRDHITPFLLNKTVQVKFLRHDKYGGRIVGEVYFKRDVNKNLWYYISYPFSTRESYINLSDYLIECGYAKKYGGEKKNDWTTAELNAIIKSLDI